MGIPSSSRGGTKARLVAVHTAESARTATSLRSYFDRTESASSHVAIDATTTLEMVPRSRAAWTLRNGNPYSVNAELCAFAAWSRADWLSTGTVQGCANPRKIVSRAAAWARRECLALGIPMVKLSPADVRAGKAGIIGHHDYTVGMRDGSHWDPGPNFPWDIFMAEVRRGGAAPTEEDDIKFTDTYTDHAGNKQSLQGTLNNLDRRLIGLQKTVGALDQDDDAGLGFASTYTDAWGNRQTLGGKLDILDKRLIDLNKAIDALTKQLAR